VLCEEVEGALEGAGDGRCFLVVVELDVGEPRAEATAAVGRDLLTSEEREELKRLRKENAELRRADRDLEGRSCVFCDGLTLDGLEAVVSV
jgi:hypothetical protein